MSLQKPPYYAPKLYYYTPTNKLYYYTPTNKLYYKNKKTTALSFSSFSLFALAVAHQNKAVLRKDAKIVGKFFAYFQLTLECKRKRELTREHLAALLQSSMHEKELSERRTTSKGVTRIGIKDPHQVRNVFSFA